MACCRPAILIAAAVASPAASQSVTLDAAADAAIRYLDDVAVRDGRDSLAQDLAIALVYQRRCPRAAELLRAHPGALATGADQVAGAAVRSGDVRCIGAVAGLLAQIVLPAEDLIPSPGPEVRHLAGALLLIAGHADGAALIRDAEQAMITTQPLMPTLSPATPPRLRVLLEGLQARMGIEEKLSGRGLGDERLWEARDGELALYADVAKPRYAATLNRYAAAALAAGRKVRADVLDDLATRSAEQGQSDRATALMAAAVRNEDNPNTEHSLASRDFDRLIAARDYAGAAATIDHINPTTASSLIDLAVGELATAQPAVLLPYLPKFDRWAGDHPARAAGWLSDMAQGLASAGTTAAAQSPFAGALALLHDAPDGEEWNDARSKAVRAALALGDDAAAWSLIAAGRGNADQQAGLIADLAFAALAAGREASVDRALARLPREQQGFIFEHALAGAPHAAVGARQRIVARALAFAAEAEPLQARRIFTALAQETAAQLDLPDTVAAVLAAAPADLRVPLAIEAAARASGSAEVARELHQPIAQAEARRRTVALTRIALASVAALSDDDRVKLSRLGVAIGDFAASRRLADAVVDPAKREQAYVTLVATTPSRD